MCPASAYRASAGWLVVVAGGGTVSRAMPACLVARPAPQPRIPPDVSARMGCGHEARGGIGDDVHTVA